MAGMSTKEIKNRIWSMKNTRQITKAMEMVSASRLRKAQAQVITSRPYFEILYATINEIVDSTGVSSSPYLSTREENKVLYVVIAGDRGLAGGYNNNVLKLATAHMKGKQATVLPLGKKALEHFDACGIDCLTENYAEASSVSLGDCFTVAKWVSKLFLNGAFDAVYVCYTNSVSSLSQVPSCLRLVPLIRQRTGSEGVFSGDVFYEPDVASVLDAIIPEYIGGIIYGALCESRTSEQAARRTAMDSATKNADEMIADLALAYNRARQGAITQEITEIVTGSQ